MSKGMMIVAIAAVVALICFFLPWVAITVAAPPAAPVSASGLTLAKGATTPIPIPSAIYLFLAPLAMIGCLVLAFFAYRHQVKIRTAAYIAIGLAVVSLIVILIKATTKSAAPTSLVLAAWLTIVANVAIIAGGVLDYLKP